MKWIEVSPALRRSCLKFAVSLGACVALSGCARPASQVLVDATMLSAHRPTFGAYTRPLPGIRNAAGEAPRYEILSGDTHCHVSPPDQPPHVTRGVAETVELARDEGLDFVVLTPHVGARFFQDEAERAYVVRDLARLTREVREAKPGKTIFVTGIEYTDHAFGHVGVAFADIERVLSAVPTRAAVKNPERFFEEVVAQGGVLMINHPLVTPLDSIIPMARADLSWRPFLGSGPFPPEIVAVNRLALGLEAYNLTATHLRDRYLLGDTELTLRATLRRIDDEIVSQKRRIVPVGGSDSHSGHLRAMMFVLSEGRTEGAIRDALVAGRLCVRDPAACSFEARADGGPWVTVGGSLAGTRSLEVRAHGEDIELIVNGAVSEALPKTGSARIEVDPSRCSVLRVRVGAGFSAPIYANCPFADRAPDVRGAAAGR